MADKFNLLTQVDAPSTNVGSRIHEYTNFRLERWLSLLDLSASRDIRVFVSYSWTVFIRT